jgi:preprotein translocase subunit SecE
MALEIYKKGQGYYTRMGTAIGLGLMALFGCYALYNKLGVLLDEQYLGPQTGRWVQLLVSAVVLVGLGWLIYFLINRPSYADFMISTEGEMKKVSWSTRKEVIASTKVVIGTVIFMAFLLAGIDLFFTVLFQQIGILGKF